MTGKRPPSVSNWKPDMDRIFLDKLTSSILDLKRQVEEDDPPSHTSPRENVLYQLSEEPSHDKRLDTRSEGGSRPSLTERRVMGFRAFCEAVEKRQRSASPTE